jgi:Fe-S-cluster-containing dehydrogenase component
MIALDRQACSGCGICIKICPHRVLAFSNKKALLACPAAAIAVTKGTGCLFTIIREDILKLNQAACACS